uniref:TSA: Wollemia nobilis Ref_Wollemi_Transcript_4156_1616 transcribed RNA sequence n=1 Tax=Wollemia nobilis TaxID=56998 RepID=A0A0C9QWI9_9CONI
MTNGVPTEKGPLLPKKRSASDEAGDVHDGFNGASFSGAVFNLCTTVVGAGIMALPATVKVLGLVLTVFLIIAVALLTDVSIGFLLRFSRASERSSYGGVMGDAFGRLGRMVLQMSVIVSNLGILIVYMIIIGDVLSGTSASDVHHTGILEQWFGIHWWNGRIVVLLVTTVLVLGPLVALKRVDSLRYTSALSVALAVLFVVVTAGIAIVKLFSGDAHMPKLLPSVEDHASMLKLFTVVPVIVTAYVCHYNVHSINNELEDQSEMPAIVYTSLALCSIVYITTSFFGFLLFGDQTMDDVLANFDTNLGVPYSQALCDIVRIAYVLHLMLVFPLIFFALRLNLDGLFFSKRRALIVDNQRFVLITIGLIAVLFLGATFIPNIWVAFQFTGTTAAICIGFIFPAAIVLRDIHGISTKKERYLSWSMIVLAVVSSLIAISGDFFALVKKSEGGSPTS